MHADPGDKRRGSGAPAPTLPELPLSPNPNLVTASGLAQLEARRRDAERRLDALEPGDDVAREYLARHLRWLQARIETAMLVGPRLQARDRAGFGAWVELADTPAGRQRLRIVGEDEADPEHGLLSWVGPLARALEGARAGDRVRWRRADEFIEVEVLAIDYPDEPGARH